MWLPPSAGTACRMRCLRWCLSSFGLGKISLGNSKMPIVTEEVWGVAKDAASPRSLPEPLLLVWRPHCERQGSKSFKVLCILYVNWGPKKFGGGPNLIYHFYCTKLYQPPRKELPNINAVSRVSEQETF